MNFPKTAHDVAGKMHHLTFYKDRICIRRKIDPNGEKIVQMRENFNH